MRARLVPSTFRFPPVIFCLLAFLAVLCYLAASRLGGFLGFALDDAWIHQTYARNLAQWHQFAFVPGQPSAGSTSPLWTLLLAVSYLFHINYLVWTYLLGAVLLALNAWLAYRLALVLWPERTLAAALAGVCVALEWHLIWSAVSGMETLLFTALALTAFVIPPRRAGWLGLCVGLSVLARPDGLTLLPFVMASLLVASSKPVAHRVSDILRMLFGFALVFIPYLAFNYLLGGTLWPNTFYAKQAEYAIHRQLPLWTRIVSLGLQPWVGAQALLVPGLGLAGWNWMRQRRWDALLPVLWAGAFIAAYVVRLPVTYQHGRYLMPVIPVLVVVGVGGTAQWLRLQTPATAARQGLSLPRLISRAWAAAFVLVGLAFGGLGAKAYQADVQFIETEMVWPANWINHNTPPEAVIAAHDIGALGYFGQRQILDLAGLVSPDVIPFIRDERQLGVWLAGQHAGYLMTFPGWYPDLVRALAAPKVYPPPGLTVPPYSQAPSGEHMTVYRLRGGP